MWVIVKITISTWRSIGLGLLSPLSDAAQCQGAQDLEQLLVSICTPDLKTWLRCDPSVVRGLWRQREESTACQDTLAHPDSLHPPQTCAVMLLQWWKKKIIIGRSQAFSCEEAFPEVSLFAVKLITQSVLGIIINGIKMLYSAPLVLNRLEG